MAQAQTAADQSANRLAGADSTCARKAVKSIAAKKGITLPADLDAKDQAAHDRLSKLHGDAFDRPYMADMLRDYRADIAEFEREAARGSDADLKAFASKTLPTLQQHLRMAQD